MVFFACDRQALQDSCRGRWLAQENAAESIGYRTLIGFQNRLATLPVSLPDAPVDKTKAAAETTLLNAARATLDALMGDERDARKGWLSKVDAWTAMAAAGPVTAHNARSAGEIASLFASFGDRDLQGRDLSYALRIATIGGSDFQERFEASVGFRKQAEDLKDGTKDGQPPVVGIPEKHPELALPVFQNAASSLDTLLADINALEQKLRLEKQYVTASTGLAVLVSGYDTLLGRSQVERANVAALIAAAESQIAAAALKSREGITTTFSRRTRLARIAPTRPRQGWIRQAIYTSLR